MSVMLRLPVLSDALAAVVTVSFVNATDPAAAVAFVERQMPFGPRGGSEFPRGASQPIPIMPAAVATKIVAGSFGCTRILLIVRPLKGVVPETPL